MSQAYPPVVVYDAKKAHHLGIVELLEQKRVLVLCTDCPAEYEMPLYLLGPYLDRVAAEGETQIVSWVRYER